MRKVTKSNKPSKCSEIGERIRFVRTSQNLSQQDLADKVYKSRPEINYFETGARKPDIDTFINIAKELNVSLDYLGGLNDIEKPNAELQAINDLLGLSEKAIYQLTKYKNSKEILTDFHEDYEIAGVEREEQKLAMFNMLLENPKFEEILDYMIDYECVESELDKQPTEMAFQRNNKKMLEDKRALIEYKISKKMCEILNEKD